MALDAIRGLCLVFMNINHLPGNWMQRFTFQTFGFIGDREVFVFLSGLVTAWLCGSVWQKHGTIEFLLRVVRAIARLYLVAMAVTFTILLATLLGGQTLADWRQLVFYANVSWGRFFLSLITFRHTIVFITLLRFYCLLLFIMPLILYALKRRKERLLLAAAITMWLAVQFTVAPHLAGMDKRWQPWVRIFAWQPLYVLGAMAGYRRYLGAQSIIPRFKILVGICMGAGRHVVYGTASIFFRHHQRIFPGYGRASVVDRRQNLGTPPASEFSGVRHRCLVRPEQVGAGDVKIPAMAMADLGRHSGRLLACTARSINPSGP